jgi:hypothetical protein
MESVRGLLTSTAVGVGWSAWVQSPRVFNSSCSFLCPRAVRDTSKLSEIVANSLSARVLIRRGNVDGARAIMTKIYAYANPEEVDLKVCRSHCDPLLLSNIDHQCYLR